MIPAQELVERGLAVGRGVGGRRLHRAGRGDQPRRRPLRAEHDHDQRGAARALGQRDRLSPAARPARRGGPASSGPTAWPRWRRRRWPTRGGRRRPRTPSPWSSRPQARPARDFGLDPEETDSGALDGVLSSLSGAFGRARARDAVLAGFAEQDVATLYLGSSTGLRLSHAQPTGAVNLVGRTADGTGSAWVGEPTIAPSLERDGGTRSGAGSTGPRRRSRSRPAATR